MIYIFWSCRNKVEAKKIIDALLEKRWIACASIFPEVESMYRWEGKIEEGKEAKVILKTAKRRFSEVREYIASHCSYAVPEIVQVEITSAHQPYVSWVLQETK